MASFNGDLFPPSSPEKKRRKGVKTVASKESSSYSTITSKPDPFPIPHPKLLTKGITYYPNKEYEAVGLNLTCKIIVLIVFVE